MKVWKTSLQIMIVVVVVILIILRLISRLMLICHEYMKSLKHYKHTRVYPGVIS